MTEKTIVKVSGIVKKKLAASSGTSAAGKAWTKNTFIVKPTNGGKDIFISTFGKFDNSFVGKQVSFDAEHNSQYNSYMLKGEITDATPEEFTEPVAEEVPKLVAKKKTATPKAAPVVNDEEVSAEELVEENLVLAGKLLAKLKLGAGAGVSDIVAVADMIGRCKTALRIEAGKNSRMDRFKK